MSLHLCDADYQEIKNKLKEDYRIVKNHPKIPPVVYFTPRGQDVEGSCDPGNMPKISQLI
jgi:hypothetical protein